MARAGRPSTYTAEKAAAICTELASGKSLIRICKQAGMPHISTVFDWFRSHPEFAESYARARESQADFYAAEIVELSDAPRIGEKVERKQIGWQCPACKQAAKWYSQAWVHCDGLTPICEGVKKPDRVYEEKVVTGDMIERSKLQVDTRRWLMGRLAPKKYGDRIEQRITDGEGKALTLVLQRPGKAKE